MHSQAAAHVGKWLQNVVPLQNVVQKFDDEEVDGVALVLVAEVFKADRNSQVLDTFFCHLGLSSLEVFGHQWAVLRGVMKFGYCVPLSLVNSALDGCETWSTQQVS